MSSEIQRRKFLKGAGITTGVMATGVTASQMPELSPVGRSRAVAPVIAAGYIFAAGYVAGKELDFWGDDQVDEQREHRDLWLMADENRFLQDEISKTVTNDIEGSANIARSEAYHSAFNSLNSGLSEQEAKEAARLRVQEYYKKVQENVLTSWNRVVQRTGYMLARAYQDGLLDSSNSNGSILRVERYTDERKDGTTYTSDGWRVWNDSDLIESEFANADEAGAVDTEIINLADGSQTERARYIVTLDLFDARSDSTGEEAAKRFQIDGYDDSTSRIEAVNGRDMENSYDPISTKATSMANEAETIVSDVYTEFTAGEVDPSQYYSAIDMLELYGVDDKGSMGSGAMSLAMQGYDTRLTRQVDLTIDPYSSDPTTNSGILCLKRSKDSYSRSTPYYDEHLVDSSSVPDGETRYSSDETKEDGKWVSSATYDGSKMNRRLVLVRQDGRKVDLSSSVFSVDKIVDLESGEEVSSMTLEDMGYQSSDPTKAAENVKKTKQAVTEIKVTTDGSLWGGGGGLGGLGDFSVLGLSPLASGGLVLGAGAAVYGGVTAFAGGAAEGITSGLSGGGGGGGEKE